MRRMLQNTLHSLEGMRNTQEVWVVGAAAPRYLQSCKPEEKQTFCRRQHHSPACFQRRGHVCKMRCTPLDTQREGGAQARLSVAQVWQRKVHYVPVQKGSVRTGARTACIATTATRVFRVHRKRSDSIFLIDSIESEIPQKDAMNPRWGVVIMYEYARGKLIVMIHS